MRASVRMSFVLVFVGLCAFSKQLSAQTEDEVLSRATRPFASPKKPVDDLAAMNHRYSDSVDPFSGNLSAKMNGISLPGHGGLNIDIDWSYAMDGLRNSGSSRMSPVSSVMFDDVLRFAGAWHLNFAPRIAFHPAGNNNGAYHLCSPPPATPGYTGILAYGFERIYVERADGRADRLYYTAPGVFTTHDHWQLSCDGTTQLLRSPDGIAYRLANKSVSPVDGRYVVTYQTTRATDRSGNYYDISYQALAVRDCSVIGGNATAIQVPSAIAASDGRALSFTYDAGSGGCVVGGRGARLTSVQGPGGATWQFQYHPGATKSVTVSGVTRTFFLSGQLSRVTLPDNTFFQFEYQDVCPTTNASFFILDCGRSLAKVTFPGGGFVGYDYRTSFDVNAQGYARYLECTLEDSSGCSWNSPPGASDPSTWNQLLQQSSYVFGQPDVTRRYTSAGGEWTYAYSRAIDQTSGAGAYDVTTINGPDGAETHRFFGLGYFSPAGLNGYSRFTNVCNEDAVPAIPYSMCSTTVAGAWRVGLPVDVLKGAGYLESYTWTPRVLTTLDDAVVAGRVRISDGAQVLVPDLQQKRIVLNGATYEINHSNFDQYGNPGTVSESGPNGGSRVTTLTYYNNTAKWIIGQPQNESFTGRTTIRTFDAQGRLASVAVDGASTSYDYDAAGNVVTMTLPRNLVHSYSNYKLGIARAESQPEGVSIVRVVDDAGNIVSYTNGEARTTTYAFDGLKRLTRITPPIGQQVTLGYTASSVTTVRGSLTQTRTYDGLGRPASDTFGGIVRTYQHDASGRLSFESNPDQTVGTHYQYDILDRVTRITHPDTTFRTLIYGAGNVTVRDERNYDTVYTYRGYGEPGSHVLMGITAPVTAANVTIVREANDLLKSVTQAGVTRSFGYDTRNYLVSETNPETGTTVFERDAAGNMGARTIAGARTDYAYDGQNRLSAITYSDGTPAVTRTYSKTHKLRTVSSSVASRVLGYDWNDNLTSESLTVGAVMMGAQYAYNGNDQLSSITYPVSSRIVSYSPDALGRPTQVSGYASAVSYWPSGQIREITYGNGLTSGYAQNARLWPSSFYTRSNAAYYVSSAYGYDGAGNLTSVSDGADSTLSRGFGYDGIGRLTAANGPWGSGSLSYDGAGNVRTQSLGAFNLTYNYDASNRLSSVSGSRASTYSYDIYGNVSASSAASFLYDGALNLTCASCSTTNRVDYAYDGLSKRVRVSQSGVSSYEFYGVNGDLLAQYTPSQSNRLVEYIYLGGKRIAQRTSDDRPPTALSASGGAAIKSDGSVTLSVNVAGTSPGGSVTFYEGGVLIGIAPVIDGRASLEVQGLALGSHTITAVYSGDGTNSGNTLVYVVKVSNLRWLPAVLDLLLN